MKLTIITPSLNQLTFLKRNMASVSDQKGVEVEHIVQDAGSTDGTVEWLAGRTDVVGIVEKDEGMYDAINRGIRRSSGDVLAWLNCDEQYLPGALQAVRKFFEASPDVDLVFGHAVVVDEEGNYLCHRKAVVPSLGTLRIVRLPIHSCSMFFRRRVIEEGMEFDTKWKAIGDWDWVMRAKRKGFRMGLVEAFLSTHADTGENLILSPRALEELKRAQEMMPWHVKLGGPLVRMINYGKKLMSGYYRQEPFSFDLYVGGGEGARRRVNVAEPTYYWKGRMFSS